MNSRIYRSRISPILWPIIWLFVAGAFYLTIRLAFTSSNIFYITILVTIWILILGFILTVMLGVRYQLDSDELTIKIGPVTERRISPQNIWSLERSYNVISSPANALKRIKITYSDGYVLISPMNEREFLEHLKSINPEIKLISLKT